MKMILAILLVFVMLPVSLYSCGGASDESSRAAESDIPVMGDISVESADISDEISANPEGSISVVVLGDSIARGYGLKNAESERFSSVLGESLKNIYSEVSIANYGVDGQTGAELSEVLKNTPPKELKDCDCVIISIGGNNILGGLTSLETAFSALSELDPNALKDYFNYMMASEDSKELYSQSCEILSQAFGIVNSAFESDTYKQLTEEAGTNLTSEIPQIVSEIRKLNPDAKIYIQTVYNPYKGLDITLDGVENPLKLATYGEDAVSKLNAPIKSLAEENGYTAVPVWERFGESESDLVNAGIEILKGEIGFDPHPNAKGHALIAEIYRDLLTEDKNG